MSDQDNPSARNEQKGYVLPQAAIWKIIVLSAATAALTSAITALIVSGGAFFAFNNLHAQKLPQAPVSGNESAAGPLSSQEAAVEASVDKVSPSVVSVVATKDLPVIEQYFANPFGNDPNSPFNFPIPQYRQQGTQPQQVAAGTGFVVSSDGLIVTNRHVVEVPGASFTVLFTDGTKLDATVLAKDPVEDVAILKVDRTGLPAVSLADSDQARVGQSVIAIGNSLGQFQNSVSVGVISGLARRIEVENEVIEGAIQTDAAINPGNSGGPLLNLNGEAVGINTAIVVNSQNVGFAIPINKAKKDIEDVKRNGKISYAYLGVRYIDVTPDIKSARNLSVDYGALILGSAQQPGVEPGSPAAEAGLREGDVILSVNGQRIDATHSLSSRIRTHHAGEHVALHVMSGSDERDVTVTLKEQP